MACPAPDARGLSLARRGGSLEASSRAVGAQVFYHNAWDSMEWLEGKAEAAERKVRERVPARRARGSKLQKLGPQDTDASSTIDYEVNTHMYWNDIYKIHENSFLLF